MRFFTLRKVLLLALAVFVVSCSVENQDKAAKPGQTFKPHLKIGKPYKKGDTWYYPKAQPDYDETGIASWYGPGFHGKATANGERYDQNALTAAHTTLPLPVKVRVTNLENGRQIVVRVNDRGPFAHGRLIDLSKRGAELLGFKEQGTAKVRVEYLGPANLEYFISPKPVTEKEERYAATAVPVKEVTSGSLPPPPGARVAPDNLHGYPKPAQTDVNMKEPDVRVVPVSPNPMMFVQTGSFQLRANAMRQQSRLLQEGHPASIVSISPVRVNGIEFYRVRVGPVPDLDKADNLLQLVLKSGYAGARIVVDQPTRTTRG